MARSAKRCESRRSRAGRSGPGRSHWRCSRSGRQRAAPLVPFAIDQHLRPLPSLRVVQGLVVVIVGLDPVIPVTVLLEHSAATSAPTAHGIRLVGFQVRLLQQEVTVPRAAIIAHRDDRERADVQEHGSSKITRHGCRCSSRCRSSSSCRVEGYGSATPSLCFSARSSRKQCSTIRYEHGRSTLRSRQRSR